jgi:VWFA-related protein
MARLVVAIFAAMSSVTMTAQQPSAQPPTFRAAADIVEVDVVVQEKSGRFVGDLTARDFIVREEGAPQPIDLFYLVNGNSRVSTPNASQGVTPAGDERTPAARVAPRVFIAFFDDQHLTPAGFKRVQTAVLELFSKHFKDGDVGGVVVNQAMVNNRLTTVREELIKAVRDAKTSAKSNTRLFEERTWPRLTEVESIRIALDNDQPVFQSAYQRACAVDPDACAKLDVPSIIREKARMMTDTARASTNRTLQNLAAVMNGLSRMDGRKTVLLLSEGFLAEESWPLVQQTVGLAAGANARVYTLDARGLDRQGLGDRLTGVDPGTDDVWARLLNQFDMGSDSMNSLAVDTGGFVVRNQNIFDKAVEQIVADAGTYYVLGYRPATAPDGKFRKLSVTVNRPGVIARARRGYVATAKPASSMTSDAARGSTGSPRADREAVRTAAAPSNPDSASVPATSVSTNARPERVEGLAGATVVPRVRPDAAKHVETLSPATAAGTDADATEGWAAYQRGNLESARGSLARAATRPAAPPWVFYALGQSQYALTQFADAAAAWERVRSTTPDFRAVYFDLVDAYLQIKDYDKATRVLRDGERRWPSDAELLNALGVVQVTRGALDDAVHSFELAAAAAPSDAVAYFNLGKVFELRYWKYRRFVSQTRQWIANGNDRNKAIDNYKRYLQIGGPLENAAREGLTRLEWSAR